METKTGGVKQFFVIMSMFWLFSMVYFWFGEYLSDIWSTVFFLFLYGVMISALWRIVGGVVRDEKVFVIASLVYFKVLWLMYLYCLFFPEKYEPVIKGTKWVILPFLAMVIGVWSVKFYGLIKKIKKP